MDERYYDRERGGRSYEDDRWRGDWRRGSERRDDRGFFERAGDEVRTWFGDEEAQRRRVEDERRYGDPNWGSRGQTEWERWRSQGRDREPSSRGWERPSGQSSGTRSWDRPEGSQRYGEERSWGGYGGSSYGSQEYGGQGFGRGSSQGSSAGQQGAQSGRQYGSRDSETERWGQSGGWGSQSEDSRSGQSRGQYGASQFGGQSTERGRQDWEPRPIYSYSEYWFVSGPHAGRGPKGYQRSDDRIKEDICERLLQHGQLDASDLEVSVNNGEVTLSGSVRERQAKRMAEDVAEAVSGVKEVNNQIRLTQQGMFGQDTSSGQSGQSRGARAA